MRTTVDIDDQLLRYAKQQAAQQGCTLKQVLEDALRDFFFINLFRMSRCNWKLFREQV